MQIHKRDNVEVNLEDGHKYALCAIHPGEAVVKYGYPIGRATEEIAKGEWVHTHNLRTALGETESYEYTPALTELPAAAEERCFLGYRRANGEIGIRNELWVIPTVGCVNHVAEALAKEAGAYAFLHPFGCSQLGADKATTERVLAGLIRHPNAAGVLVVGLGCENSNIGELKQTLGDYDPERVRFLNCQDVGDELAEGRRMLAELKAYADRFVREPLPLSALRVGLKCGGSDGFSGITANPLVGRFSDALIAAGGSTVLTEVPEMFGAERILMNRCKDRATFLRTVDLINGFKEYFVRHGQVVYENPSPGNKAGGITTLEEKSLGCVQKGGSATVVDVLDIGETPTQKGLSLLDGPGNDLVALTNLVASGVHLILFTTGRGTPLGAPVPTVKISTNTDLAEKKPHWIDFDAGCVLTGQSDRTRELMDYCIRVAEGEETNNERNGFREISIFKDGVVL